MNIKDKIYNINGEYVKFYFTANPNLPQLLKNTGCIVILLNYSSTPKEGTLKPSGKSEKIFSMWIAGEKIFEGLGFNKTWRDYIIEQLPSILERLTNVEDHYVFNGQYIEKFKYGDPLEPKETGYQIPNELNLNSVNKEVKLANVSDNFIYISYKDSEGVEGTYPLKLKYLSDYINFLFDINSVNDIVELTSCNFNIEYYSSVNDNKKYNTYYTKYGSNIVSSDIDYISLNLNDEIIKLTISLNIIIKKPGVKLSKAILSCRNSNTNKLFTQTRILDTTIDNEEDTVGTESHELTFSYDFITKDEIIKIVETNQIILDDFILTLSYIDGGKQLKINDNIISQEETTRAKNSLYFDINNKTHNIELSKIGVIVDSNIFIVSEVDMKNKVFNTLAFNNDNNIQLNQTIANTYYNSPNYYCPCIFVNHKYNVKDIYAMRKLPGLFEEEEKEYININHRLLHNNEYIINTSKSFISITQDEKEFDVYYLNILEDLSYMRDNTLLEEDKKIYYHIDLEERNTSQTFKRELKKQLTHEQLCNRIFRNLYNTSGDIVNETPDYEEDKYINSSLYDVPELINYKQNDIITVTINGEEKSIKKTDIGSLQLKLNKLYL